MLLNRLDHLIAQLRRLGKAGFKVCLDALELLPVGIHVAEGDAFGPVLFTMH